jgi:MFS family permease
MAEPGGLPRRTLLALVAGQLGVHAAMAGLRLAAPLQALREGHSAWSVGLLLALFAGAAVVSAMRAGRLADTHGYHRPMKLAVAATVAGMLCALASVWAPEPWRFALLCLAAAGTGMGTNTGMLTIQRTASHAAGSATERVRIFSWLGVAPSFSNVVGPVAAGLMIDAAGFAAAYALLLALPLITLVSARQVPRHTPQAADAGRDDDDSRAAWDLLRLPAFRRLLLVNGLLAMCWDVHTFAVPVLGHERGFSASTIGLILGAFTLSVTGVRLLIPLLAHRLDETTVVRSAMLGCGVVFLLYPLAPNPLVMGGCALLLGLALGSVQPMVMSLLHEVTPGQRHGEALALRSMVINTSSTVLPLLFGASGALVGAAALFWAAGGAVGAGSWLARRLQGA